MKLIDFKDYCIYYLKPLSYGIPSASGVEVFLENTISAIIVATNGNMFQNDTGIGRSGAKIETFSANTLVPPKNSEANVIVIGLYLPKINAANAKYPNPYTVIAALNPWENVVAMIAPANPARHPEINTPM